MRITTVVENNTISREYKKKHGLCLYIKTKSHKILFDLGPDNTFIKNAEKLNIDIKDIDILVISHGHKDHGGGLEAFLNYNNKAKIYMSKYAFEEYYASVFKFGKAYVGLNKNLKLNKRIIFTDDFLNIGDEMMLISNVKGNVLSPKGNKSLLVKENEKYILDDFKHEQHLVLKEDGKNILISGCSHTGILNIIESVENVLEDNIHIVVGGLHLFNPINKKTEDISLINQLGKELSKMDLTIFTCHCTGKKAFKELEKIIGDRINSICTGEEIEV